MTQQIPSFPPMEKRIRPLAEAPTIKRRIWAGLNPVPMPGTGTVVRKVRLGWFQDATFSEFSKLSVYTISVPQHVGSHRECIPSPDGHKLVILTWCRCSQLTEAAGSSSLLAFGV